MRRLLLVSGSVLALLAGNVAPARSQIPRDPLADIESPLADEGVLERSRPELDPLGVRLGVFLLFPSVRLGASYDSNVLRTDSDTQDDWVFEMTPGFILRSDWTRHYLAARASATRYRYGRVTSENRTEWNASAGGRLDILTGFNLSGAGSIESTFEDRTSRDQAGAARPTPFTRSGARAALSYNPARVGLQLGGEFEQYDYGRTELVPELGGGERDNDDRNRDVYSIYATALYEFSPGYAAFIRPGYERRTYELDTGRAAGRNSDAYTVDAGVSLLLTRLISGEAYLGYLNYDLEGVNFQDLSGLNYGAQIRWFPTELITVHLNASRTPNATTITGASVGDDRYVSIGADYELLRNVIVQGSLAYTDSRFSGTERRDEDFGAQLGVQYLMNRYLTANLRIARTTRSSNAADAGFVDNILFVALRGHL